MKLLTVLLLTLSLSTQAANIELDFGYTKIEHAWRGPNNNATFKVDMPFIGVTAWWNNIGIRGAYARGGKAFTKGRYDIYYTNLSSIKSIELLYRYKVTNRLTLIAGIGQYYNPTNLHLVSDGSLFDADTDHDEGYTFKANYRVYKGWSVGYSFTQQSRIKKDPYDEWIRGHAFTVSYLF